MTRPSPRLCGSPGGCPKWSCSCTSPPGAPVAALCPREFGRIWSHCHGSMLWLSVSSAGWRNSGTFPVLTFLVFVKPCSLSPDFVARRAAARGVPCAKPDALVPFLYVMDGMAREGSPSVRVETAPAPFLGTSVAAWSGRPADRTVAPGPCFGEPFLLTLVCPE